jgi:uncharacterized protein (TIGR03000 family)
VAAVVLLVTPARGPAFFGDFSSWPNVHWPSGCYYFTYGDGEGNYSIRTPRGGPYLVTPADMVWYRTGDTALVEVLLPANDAELSVQGKPMAMKGIRRRFVSPPLGSGRYTYELTARWGETEIKPVEQTRRVSVRAGERVTVDFTQPAPK